MAFQALRERLMRSTRRGPALRRRHYEAGTRGRPILSCELHVRAAICLMRAMVTAGCCGALAACSTNTGRIAKIEAEPEIVASPQVVAAGLSVPKGGGRYQVGVPYQIAGTWYKPSED